MADIYLCSVTVNASLCTEFTHAILVSHSPNEVLLFLYLQHKCLTNRFMAVVINAVFLRLAVLVQSLQCYRTTGSLKQSGVYSVCKYMDYKPVLSSRITLRVKWCPMVNFLANRVS